MSNALEAPLWPNAAQCAVSIAFDDGYPGQLRFAVPALEKRKLRASFYLPVNTFDEFSPRLRQVMLERWAAVAKAGHEIGNHTRSHPASTNFPWTRELKRAVLEDLSLADIERDIDAAQAFFTTALGHTPATFAYPCGMSFVGRGVDRQSYVPLVARRFVVGRSFHDESAAAPLHCDLSHVPAIGMDHTPAESLHALVDDALKTGAWLILVGHDLGTEAAPYKMLASVLESLLDHIGAHGSAIWTDTVEQIGRHVHALQTSSKVAAHKP